MSNPLPYWMPGAQRDPEIWGPESFEPSVYVVPSGTLLNDGCIHRDWIDWRRALGLA